ncbi:hypothetical protein BD414DRAFT_496666 [Trametes punicea]|nr:hypothetical protein BD414DRAFT_496666 [Trametes punicea]
MARPSAYIGVPPPHLRKRKQREPSPAIPDPEPPTPDRRDAFWTPNHSARVKKTYAHKRARSYASSALEDGSDDALKDSSRSSTPQSSPIRPKGKARLNYDLAVQDDSEYQDPSWQQVKTKDTDDSSRLILGDAGHSVAIPQTSPRSAGPSQRKPRKHLVAYVEIPRRPRPAVWRGQVTGAASARHTEASKRGIEIDPGRGRPSEQKATAFPSPPPSDEDFALEATPTYYSRDQVFLSEALNRSFATMSPRSVVPKHLPDQRRSPSPPKRKCGRPRGRGRGLAALGPVIAHGEVSTSRQPNAAGASAQTHNVSVSAPQVKRGPGRPRKHPLPRSPAHPVSANAPRQARSSSPSRSKARAARPLTDEDGDDIDAIVEQLLRGVVSPSPENARDSSPSRGDYAYQSIDIGPLARALERQAMDEAVYASEAEPPAPPASPLKRPRGRPRGSKNKSTLAREAEARAARLQRLLTAPSNSRRASPAASAGQSIRSSLPPVPIRRPRGRPRKSAPSAFPSLGTMDYLEPLKDPDEDPRAAGPSMPRSRSRGRSHTRRNSLSALPTSVGAQVASPAYYLDLNTMQWKRRSRSVSASPKKRSPSRARAGAGLGEPKEYQTNGMLFTALRKALMAAAATPKLAQSGRPMTEDGLKVAPSGVLLFLGGKDDDESETANIVFNGTWVVLEDPNMAFDDGLVMKKLHEVVLAVGGSVRLGDAQVSRSPGGRVITVAVPCCCQSVLSRPQPYSNASSATYRVECEGEMTVSIREEPAMQPYTGLAKVLRTTVTVTH